MQLPPCEGIVAVRDRSVGIEVNSEGGRSRGDLLGAFQHLDNARGVRPWTSTLIIPTSLVVPMCLAPWVWCHSPAKLEWLNSDEDSDSQSHLDWVKRDIILCVSAFISPVRSC